MKDRVSDETTNVFNEDFWRNLDGVTNALDNIEGRQYVDSRCVFFQRPLLESGTLGTKGNTQVVVPNVTESYSQSADPPEKSIPMCIARNFPNKIEHCIHWARHIVFEEWFVETPTLVNMYLTQPNYLETALKEPGGAKVPNLEKIRDSLTTDRPRSFEDCVAWARLKFEQHFVNNIKQLLHSFPKDYETSAGTPFWSGPKRAPDALVFDPNNQIHYDFIVAAANLHAFNYNIKPVSGGERDTFLKVLSNIIVPDFSPNAGAKFQTDEKEPDPNAAAFADENEAQKVIAAIPASSDLAGFQVIPADFEKDDDSNYHIDFITVCSNLRAENYKIATLDRHQVKQIAGKIIPAIATTTALVTGLVILELFKIIDGKDDIEQYKNGFVNLALPMFAFSEPMPSHKLKYNGPNGEVALDKTWHRFELGNVTLQEFIDHFKEKHGLSVLMLSSGVSLLYAMFQGPTKNKPKLSMTMKELVEKVSRKQIPEHQTEILVEIVAEDANGDDVDDLPGCKVKIR
jgi:ubiquitin-activating enzyme E1